MPNDLTLSLSRTLSPALTDERSCPIERVAAQTKPTTFLFPHLTILIPMISPPSLSLSALLSFIHHLDSCEMKVLHFSSFFSLKLAWLVLKANYVLTTVLPMFWLKMEVITEISISTTATNTTVHISSNACEMYLELPFLFSWSRGQC